MFLIRDPLQAGGGVPGTTRHVFNQRSSSGMVVGSLELPGTFLISDPLQGSWWGPCGTARHVFLSAILFRAGGVVPGTARHVFNQRSSSGLVVGSLELPGMFFISDPLQGWWCGPWNCPACFLSEILFRAGGGVPGTAPVCGGAEANCPQA